VLSPIERIPGRQRAPVARATIFQGEDDLHHLDEKLGGQNQISDLGTALADDRHGVLAGIVIHGCPQAARSATTSRPDLFDRDLASQRPRASLRPFQLGAHLLEAVVDEDLVRQGKGAGEHVRGMSLRTCIHRKTRSPQLTRPRFVICMARSRMTPEAT
jgi:hypothetical protein